MSAVKSRMAPGARLTRLGARPSLATSSLPLPLPLRVSSLAVPRGRRGIHISAVAGGLVDLTAQTLATVHQAGLPWYLTIPLLAIGVNFTARLPVQYYNRTLLNRRQKLFPFLASWQMRHDLADRDGATAYPKSMSLGDKTRKRLYKTFGCQMWKSYTPVALSMLPFFLATETLRQMSGAPTSFMASYLTQAAPIHDLGEVHASSLFEPSLAQGGFGWVTDLTAMDPFWILPVLSTCILGTQVVKRMSKRDMRMIFSLDTSASVPNQRMRLRLAQQRVVLITPLFPLLFLDLPSAIFLYWLTTFSLNTVNEAIINKLLPKTPSIWKLPPPQPSALPYLIGPGSKA